MADKQTAQPEPQMVPGIDSREIVKSALLEVARLGLRVHNVDAVIHAEEPRLSPHRAAIRSCLSELLEVRASCIGLKAKTGEGLGEIGRGEAIAAEVAVLLEESA